MPAESGNESAYQRAGWRVSVLGDVRIDGVTGLDDKVQVACALGSSVVDLSNVDIGDDGVVVQFAVLGGNAQLIVPDGTTVIDSANSILGSAKQKLTPASPTGGVVRVEGVVVLGDLDIYAASTRPPSIGDRLRKTLRRKSG